MNEHLSARPLGKEELSATAGVEQPSDEKRQAFEPPQLLWSEPFQPVAYGMACGKNPGGGGQCNNRPAFS